MSDAEILLEQTKGMEDLFVLGGFIEETARKTIKEAWINALPDIAVRMGAGDKRMSFLDNLAHSILKTIATYKEGSENEDLYLLLMDKAEAYFSDRQGKDMNQMGSNKKRFRE